MGQLDGVTRQRLAANEHLCEVDTRLQVTVANERQSGEVLSHTLAKADVAVQRAEELRSSPAARSRCEAARGARADG